MDKNQKVQFRLAAIRTEQFAIIEEVGVDNEEIGLTAEINLGVNELKHTVECRLRITFLSNDQTFLILSAACLFAIVPVAMDEMKKGNELHMPEGFARHLGVITVGTARGILHAKTEGTRYNKFLLPTINIEEQIKGDIVFQLEAEKGA